MYYITLLCIFASLFIFIYTTIKVPSLNYFTIIFIIYGLILRPYAISINEGTIITKEYFNISDYDFGYFAASIFILVYSIGMYIGLVKLVVLKNAYKDYQIHINKKLENLLFILSIISCFIFLYIGGTDILFINRETTISMQNPFLRYLFPFVIVLLCASTIHATLAIFYDNYFIGISKIIVLFLITSILAQRGFFIIFIIIGLSLVMFYDKKQIYKLKSIVILFFIVLTLFLKDLLVSIFIENEAAINSYNFIDKILHRPDGDATEVWMLTMQYLKDHDYSYGITIINNIFNLITHNVRHSWGLDNGQDILNGFYGGSGYWDYGFGFNVTLPIETYLNFGFIGILVIYFAGFIMGRAIVYNYKSILVYGLDPALASLRLYAIWTITSSFAGLQWALIYYLAYKVLILIGYGKPIKLQTSNINTSNLKS